MDVGVTVLVGVVVVVGVTEGVTVEVTDGVIVGVTVGVGVAVVQIHSSFLLLDPGPDVTVAVLWQFNINVSLYPTVIVDTLLLQSTTENVVDWPTLLPPNK